MSPSGVILQLIHTLLLLNQYVLQTLEYFVKFLLARGKSTPQLEAVRDDGRALQKLPIHVGVVLVENEVCLADVAQIIVWCVTTGVSYMSIYDRAGYCKRHQDKLQDHIAKQQNQNTSSSKYSKSEISLHKSRCTHQIQNGYSSTNHADVLLLSLEDGRQNLVSLTRSLGSLISKNQYSPSDIVPNNVDKLLQDELGMPDPDLVLKFGCAQSLLGYLPWQCRLTEILSYPSHHHIDYKSFHCLLHSYGSTKQRFGK